MPPSQDCAYGFSCTGRLWDSQCAYQCHLPGEIYGHSFCCFSLLHPSPLTRSQQRSGVSSLFFSRWVEKTPIAPLLLWFHMRGSYFENSLCPAEGGVNEDPEFVFPGSYFLQVSLGFLFLFSLTSICFSLW